VAGYRIIRPGPEAWEDEDIRFRVPIYTMAEAARYLALRPNTFASWVKGYRREFRDRPAVTGAPLITGVRPEFRGGPSVPFIGLAEGMFLSALRRTGMPLQQIRPALELVRSELGVEHALASRRLYHDGATLLWEVSNSNTVDPDARHIARDLVVLRDGQYVFRQVIEKHLKLITYDDMYARRVGLPEYEVAEIIADPEINFGKPYFALTGTPLATVHGMLRSGETVADIADDFDLPFDQVTEVAQREGLLAA
jgi:uncharacterized protein (DUF433 family)